MKKEKLSPPSDILNFRPTVQQRAALDRISQEIGIPRAIVLRRALDAYLEAYLDRSSLVLDGLRLVEKEERRSE